MSAVAVNAWSPSSTPPSPPLSSPSAPFDWTGSPWLRGAQGLSGGSTHAVAATAGKNAWAASTLAILRRPLALPDQT